MECGQKCTSYAVSPLHKTHCITAFLKNKNFYEYMVTFITFLITVAQLCRSAVMQAFCIGAFCAIIA